MTDRTPRKRKIVKRQYYRTGSHPVGAKDSVNVTLDCGHRKHYKGSAEPKTDVVYCTDCAWCDQ